MVKIDNETGTLHCPRCDSDYLHHDAVTVRTRDREDESGVRIEVDGQRVRSEREVNFAGRRDDLEIRMWCENCREGEDDRFVLRIVQHKGQTHMYWDKASLLTKAGSSNTAP